MKNASQKKHGRFGKKDGMGMASLIIGLFVMGFMGYAAYQLFFSAAKNKEEYIKDVFVYKIGETASQAGYRILNNTGSQLNQGICKFFGLRNETNPGPGISTIFVDVDPQNQINTLAPHWDRYFPSSAWDELSTCAVNNNLGAGFNRCFRPKASKDLPQKVLDQRKYEVRVSLEPAYFGGKSRREGEAYAPVEVPAGQRSRLLALDHGFAVKTRVSYMTENTNPNAPDPLIREHKDFFNVVWAGDHTCRKTYGSRTLTLSPSGVGAGDVADFVFSDRGKNAEESLSVFFQTVTYYKARFVQLRGQTRAETLTDDENTAVSACLEEQFRCRRDNVNPRIWDPTIDAQFFAEYQNTSTAILSLDFELATSSEAIGVDEINLFSPVSPETEGVYAPDDDSVEGPGKTRVALLNSRKRLQIHAKSDGVCSETCESRLSTDFYPQAVFEYLTGEFAGEDVIVKSRKAHKCICCYSRQCNAWGNRSGPCREQPNEALDSRFPDCEAVRNNFSLSADDFEAPKVERSGNISSGACVAARRKDGKLEFKSFPCTQKLSHICYARGRFLVSQNIDDGVTEGSFDEGTTRCYQMGLEAISANELNRLINSQSSGAIPATLPNTGANFRYIDNASIGLFLAPQTDLQRAEVFSRMANNKFYWLNLKGAGNNQVMAGAPLKETSQWSPYTSQFDDNGLLSIVEDENHSFAPGTQAGILMNSRSHVGLFPAAGSQSNSIPALCWDGVNGFFKSSSPAGTIAAAHANCLAQDGFFLPPIFPLDWSYALTQIGSFDSFLPWPVHPSGDRFSENPIAGDEVDAVWVASSGDSVASLSALFDETKLSQDYVRLGDLLRTGLTLNPSASPDNWEFVSFCRNSSNEIVVSKIDSASSEFNDVKDAVTSSGPLSLCSTAGNSTMSISSKKDLYAILSLLKSNTDLDLRRSLSDSWILLK